MYMAILQRSFNDNDGYKGIYRNYPDIPKSRVAITKWNECLEITNGGMPIAFNWHDYNKLRELTTLLLEEVENVDLILIDNYATNIMTVFLGYDITNNTMFYSILGEEDPRKKTYIDFNKLNEFRLFNDRLDAEILLKYINDHYMLFEQDGVHRSIRIAKVII